MKERKKKPVWKRTWFIVLVIFIGVGFIGRFQKKDENKITIETTKEVIQEKEVIQKPAVEKTKDDTHKVLFDKFYPHIYQNLMRLGYNMFNKKQYTFSCFHHIIKDGKKIKLWYSAVYGFYENEKDSLKYHVNFVGSAKDIFDEVNTLRLIEINERVSGAIQSGFDIIANGEFGIQDIADVINGNNKAVVQRGIVIKKTWEDRYPGEILQGKGFILEKGKFTLRFYHYRAGIESHLSFNMK